MPFIPSSMKVIGSKCKGQIEAWQMPVPKPGADEVLIKVAVSGVNPVDYKVLRDDVPLGKERPFVLGCDLAGTVVAVGADVTTLRVGDEVMGMTGGLGHGPQGTLAEYAIAAASMVVPKPVALTFREAAALPLALLTGWMGIVDRAHVKAGDKVLIIGATGGVGHLLVQTAVAFGAEVWGTGSESKRHIVEQFGGTFIDYHTPEDVDRVIENSTENGRGFDIVFDTFGGEWMERSYKYVAAHGYVLEISGFSTSSNVLPLALKDAVLAFPMTCLPFMFPEEAHKALMGRLLRDALPLIEEGKIRALVDDEVHCPFSVDGVTHAYEQLEAGANKGKLVVDVIPMARRA